jgi:hypothetical protein
MVTLIQHTGVLHLIEQIPIFDLEATPNFRRILNGIPDQLSLLPERQVDLVLIILSLDVRHVDGDEDVRRLLFEPHKCQEKRCEVRRRGPLGAKVLFRGLSRDQSIGGNFLAVVDSNMVSKRRAMP